jgi:hypothetical protein
MFTCALACARYARGCTHMHAFVRSHIFGRNSSKIGENIPLRGLHAFYVRTCVCTLCAHYARACTHTIYIYIYIYICALTHFGTNSLQTFTGDRKLHGLLDLYVRACVRALGACVHFTHARICTLLNIFSPTHSLGHRKVHDIIYFYVRACVCTLCAWMHARARMCAFAHFWRYSLNNL